MIPRHFFRIARSFSEDRGSGKSAVFKFNVAFIVTAFCLVNGFAMYSSGQVDRKARTRRFAHMEDVLKNRETFSGVERKEVKDQLNLLLAQSNLVVLFGPSFQGKTQFLKYLASGGNTLVLPAMENFEDFMNFWGYQDKFELVHFNEFMGVIEHTLSRHKDKVLLIDEYEKISDYHRYRFSEALSYLANDKKLKIIIVTNSESVVQLFLRSFHAKVFEFPDMNKEEFLQCADQMVADKGLNNTLAEQFWDKVGFDLQYLDEMLGKNIKIEEFLNEKKQGIIKELRETDEDLRNSIKTALFNVSADKPLGDIFKGSKLASFLIRINAGQGYIGTVKFRNKFVVSVFQDTLLGKLDE